LFYLPVGPNPTRPKPSLSMTTLAPPMSRKLSSAAASIASGTVMLNLVVVTVAFGALGRHLHASLATTQWVATAYVLGQMASLPLMSWASARVGLKRMLLIALSAFVAACAACGAAWSIDSLIAFRALAGLAAGVIPPAGHAVVVRASGGQRLGTTMSILNVPVLAAPVFGPTLGGLMLDGLGWRWIFFLSVPLAGSALALAAYALPADEPEPRIRLDVGGLALLGGGLVLVVYGLAKFGAGHAVPTAVGSTAAGALLTATFVAHSRRRRDPLLDLGLFSRRAFGPSAVIAFLFSFGLFGGSAILPLYFQTVRGESAVTAGTLVACQGIGSVVGLLSSGFLVDRIGASPVARAAVVASVVGTIPWVLLDAHTPYWLLLAGLVIRGAGLSALMNAAYAVAYGALSTREVPSATTALNIISRLSSAVGVAVSVVLVESQLAPTGTSTAFAHTFALIGAVAAVTLLPVLLLPQTRRARTTSIPT
jgi:EmrB/QacA subfamily drug resistance transporter